MTDFESQVEKMLQRAREKKEKLYNEQLAYTLGAFTREEMVARLNGCLLFPVERKNSVLALG